MGGLKITEKGRKAFATGLDGVDPLLHLVMEIMTRVGSIDENECFDLACQAVEQSGSAENAVMAIKGGNLVLNKVT